MPCSNLGGGGQSTLRVNQVEGLEWSGSTSPLTQVVWELPTVNSAVLQVATMPPGNSPSQEELHFTLYLNYFT